MPACQDSDGSGSSDSAANQRVRSTSSRKRRIESSSSASDSEQPSAAPPAKATTSGAAATAVAAAAAPSTKPKNSNKAGGGRAAQLAAAKARAVRLAPLARVRLRRVTALLEVEPDRGLQLRVKAAAFQRYLDERLARDDLPDQEDAASCEGSGAGPSSGRSVRRSARRRARPTYFSYVDSSEEDNDDNKDSDFELHRSGLGEGGEAIDSSDKKRNRSSSKLPALQPKPPGGQVSVADLQGSVFPCLRSASMLEAFNYCAQHGLVMQLHSRQPPAMTDEDVIDLLLRTYQYQSWLDSLGIADASIALSVESSLLTEMEKLYHSPKYAPTGHLPSNFFACGLCPQPNNVFEYFCDWEQHLFREHRAIRHCMCVLCDFTCDRFLGMLNHLYLFHPDQPARLRAAGQYCLVPQSFWRPEQCCFLCPHCGFEAERGLGIRHHLKDCGPVFAIKQCMLCNFSVDNVKTFLGHLQTSHGTAPRRQQLQPRRHETLSAVEIARSKDSEFICRVCKVRSPYLSLIEAHLQTHRFQLLVKCAACSQLVERDWHIINRHYQAEHPGAAPEDHAYIETPSHVILHSTGNYICPYCDFVNSSVCEFNAHACPKLRRLVPAPTEETKCTVCGVGFSTTITQEAIHSHLVNFHRVCPVCARVENTEPGDPRDPGRNCGYCEQLLHLAKNVSDASACYSDKEVAAFMQAKHHSLQLVPTQHLHLPNGAMQRQASTDLFRPSRCNWQCRLCDTSFPDIDSFSKLFALSNHLLKKHRLVPLFACPKCCHRFSSEVLTTTHIQRSHPGKHVVPVFLVEESNFFRPVSVTTVFASDGSVVDVCRPPNLGQTLHNRYKTQQDPAAASGLSSTPSSSGSAGRLREIAARPSAPVRTDSQELRYHCAKCRRKTYSVFNVEYHVKDSHPEALAYRCPIAGCGRRFTDSEYRRHLDFSYGVHSQRELEAASAAHLADANRKRFVCGICWQFTGDSVLVVLLHSEALHQQRFAHVRCPVCEFLICAGCSSLQAHLHSEHPTLLPLVKDGSVPLALEQEGGQLAVPIRLPNRPNSPAEAVGSFSCKLCGVSVESAMTVAQHWAAEHPQAKPPFGCPVCPRTWFVLREQAEAHLKEAHSTDASVAAAAVDCGQAVCDAPGCNFSKVCQLEEAVGHLLRCHSAAGADQLTLACPLCSHMRMSSLDLAKAHRRIDHAGVPPDLMPMPRLSGRTAKLMRIEPVPQAASVSAAATSEAAASIAPASAAATAAAPARQASPPLPEGGGSHQEPPAPASEEPQPPELQPQVTSVRTEPTPTPTPTPTTEPQEPRSEAEMQREIESRGLIFVPSCDVRLMEPLYPGCDPLNPTSADLAEAFRVLRVLPPSAPATAGATTNFVTTAAGRQAGAAATAQLFALPQGGGRGIPGGAEQSGTMPYPPGYFAQGGGGVRRQR
ncbi:hypothetical protein BOX15_Mlig029009g3 [Macrostomum lignano]|uniref:C2H2-type domain-containing protein n=1 Tax=Macrostomum lignano TaxID=282301 RepID=A0A267E7F7_9PLAT|nr:hypothetical protein BOX15_Mlig029009g3 [Macrostomum lignano]